MNKSRILGILRHAAGAAGALIVGLGYADEGTVQEISGAALTIAAFVASFFASEKRG